MPSNDRLDLYSASGTLLTSSARPYHQFEEVYRSLAAGTYFVRVESQDGTFNATTPYVLEFATLSTGVKVLDLSWWRTSTGISFVCDLLNNTGHNINNPDLTAYLYDSTGHQIALSYNVFSDPQIIGARHRGDCNGQFNPNSRAASVRLKFRTVTTSPAAPFPLSVYNVHGVSTATGGVFTGDVKNPSSADAQGVVVGLMVYGPNGVIRTVSVVDGFLDDVAPGHSVAFQTVADPRAVPTDVIRGWAYPSF